MGDQRIIILGCSGAGKSTLARQIGARTGLPVIHLDRLYWQPGWQKNDSDFQARVQALATEDHWVMDGNYSHSASLSYRLMRANSVILLDFPRWLCLTRVLCRAIKWYGQSRPDMAEGCPEKVDWEFLTYIWNWKCRNLPRILDLLTHFQGRTIILKSPSHLRRFLAQNIGADHAFV